MLQVRKFGVRAPRFHDTLIYETGIFWEPY